MQVVEKQGEGKFVLADRNIREGELVHVTRPLYCLPNIGKIIAGSFCIGCLAKIQKKKEVAAAAVAATTTSCEGCRSAYCSEACRALSIDVHRRTGECAVIRAMAASSSNGKSHADDVDLFVVAALIARAQAEGFSCPTEKSASRARMPQPKPKMVAEKPSRADPAAAAAAADAAMKAEIDFVMSAPRESIEKLFPEMMMMQRAAAQKQQQPASLEIPLLHPSAEPTAASPRAADAAERRAALQMAAAPTMADFFNNVSNASLMQTQPENIERLRKMHSRYLSSVVAKGLKLLVQPLSAPHRGDKVDDMISNNNNNNNTTKELTLVQPLVEMKQEKKEGDGAPSSTSPLPAQDDDDSFAFVPRVSFSFFSHVYSTYASNCFCCADAVAGDMGIGVFPDASYWNHSCDPSLVRRQDQKCLAFYARRDIAAGEPLTIDYGAMNEKHPDDPESRREQLLVDYRFWCGCPLCVAQGEKKEKAMPRQQGLEPCQVCFYSGALMRKIFSGEGAERTCTAHECRYCGAISSKA